MIQGAVPPFDLAEGGLWLVFVRFLVVAASFSVFGALTFRILVLRPILSKGPDDGSPQRTSIRLAQLEGGSLAAVISALLVWLLFEAAEMSGAQDLASGLAAVPTVLFHTSFGGVIVSQLAAFSITGLALSPIIRRAAGRNVIYTATAAAGLGVLLQAGHSHALAMNGFSLLLLSDCIHLVAAGAWLGGVVPLLIAVATLPPLFGALACRYFSRYGKACVIAVALTAAFQGWTLIGSLAGLVGTAYGYMALAKTGILLVLVGVAFANRYRFAPALLDNGTATGLGEAAARRVLLRSLALQTAVSLGVVFAAATLGSLPPALHVQPIWPFAERFSLDMIDEDADFRDEVIGALAALGAAGIAVALAFAARRLRWAAAALALGVTWFASPHLRLLLVDAYPTSFFHSPSGFTAQSIVEGQALFQQNCTSCHGTRGRGDGPLAKSLPVPPADLTAGHLWMHSDGELFWWLTHGIDDPEGNGLVMPGFGKALSENERWALIDYVRANNAGLVFTAKQNWVPPLPAPSFAFSCDGGPAVSSDALRGALIRLVFAGAELDRLPAISIPGVTLKTIVAPGEHTPPPHSAKDDCVAADPAIHNAFAIAVNLPVDALAGTQFLIDPGGWLRAMQRPGSVPIKGENWNDPAGLLAAVQQICSHPQAGRTAAHHHHP